MTKFCKCFVLSSHENGKIFWWFIGPLLLVILALFIFTVGVSIAETLSYAAREKPYDLTGVKLDNISIRVERGALITGSLEGDSWTLEAGLYQVFKDARIIGKPILGRIYPQWFGAQGDGIHDDAPALKTAIELGAQLRSPIYLPAVPVAYRLMSGLRLNGEQWLLGDGRGSTLIYEGEGAGISIDDTSGFRSRGGIEKIRLMGNHKGSTGIRIGRKNVTPHTVIRDVEVHQFRDYNVLVTGSNSLLMENVWLSAENRPYALRNTPSTCLAFQDNGGNQNTNATLINVYISQCYRGCVIEQLIGGTFLDCVFESNEHEGLRIEGKRQELWVLELLFLRSWFEGNWMKNLDNEVPVYQVEVLSPYKTVGQIHFSECHFWYPYQREGYGHLHIGPSVTMMRLSDNQFDHPSGLMGKEALRIESELATSQPVRGLSHNPETWQPNTK